MRNEAGTIREMIYYTQSLSVSLSLSLGLICGLNLGLIKSNLPVLRLVCMRQGMSSGWRADPQWASVVFYANAKPTSERAERQF